MNKIKLFVNSLTLLRLIATFLIPFIWILCNPVVSLIIIICILLTDMLDGMFARMFHVQSLFGAIMDTVADKMFGIMIVLIIGTYSSLFYLIVVMELIIAIINLGGAFLGARTYSSFLGKVKTFILGVSISLCVLYFYKNSFPYINIPYLGKIIDYLIIHESDIVAPLLFFTLGAQVMTAVDYAYHINKNATFKHQKVKYDFKTKEEILFNLFDTDYYVKNRNLPTSKHFIK